MIFKKKVLFVHHVSVVGGASYCLLSIIKELDRDKFEPIVLLHNKGPLVEELHKLDVDIFFCNTLWFYPYNHSLYNFRNLITIFNLYRSLSDFEKVIDTCQPDIVYFNNTFLFPYLRVTKRKGIKSVIHIREHWPLDQHQKQLRYIQREINEKADKIIAINEYSAKMISADTSKTTIVYDWIEMSERYKYMPMDKIFAEDTSNLKVFIYTGGMQRIKGAYEVLKTFSECITDPNSRLLVLGFTKDFSLCGTKGRIKNFLSKLGMSIYEKKVIAVANNDYRIVCIPSTYYVKHLFEQSYCMLSYFTKPHANLAMAEAIIECLPCIAARTEEAIEYSQNGELAMLFDMNNISDFAMKIAYLDEKYDTLKGRLDLHSSKIKQKFSKKDNSQRLMSVLEAL